MDELTKCLLMGLHDAWVGVDLDQAVGRTDYPHVAQIWEVGVLTASISLTRMVV